MRHPPGSEQGNKMKKNKKKNKLVIDCGECKKMGSCCRSGCWVDFEEAKKITDLNLKGEFFQLVKDKGFPSGYKIGTSYEDSPCSFLDPDGLCSIHKVDYKIKPHYCREFPYEDGRLSSQVGWLCHEYKKQKKRK